MKTLKFRTNINCSNCIRTVTPHLNALMDVESWTVDTDSPEKILSVESETGDQKEVEEAVTRAGFNIQAMN